MPIPDYSINVPDPGERLMSGMQIGQGIHNIQEQRRFAIAEQTRQAALGQAMADLTEMDRPEFSDYEKVINQLPKDQAESVRKNWELKSKEYQSGQLRNAGQIYAAFDASPDLAIKMMVERAEAEKNAGNDEAADVLSRWAEVAKIDPKLGKNTMGMMIATLPGGDKIIQSINKLQGGGAAGPDKSSAPITLVNPKTKEKILVTPVYDPKTKKARLEQADIPEGFEISRETKEEERAADLAVTEDKEGAKVTGKKIAMRRQKHIDEGLIAADGYANLKRASSLLREIKTGGINQVAMKAKRFFGIEGANEAELSNRMGKAVLSQLRTTFGAAFTAEEGKSLQVIEANYGKSTIGNQRLLDQTMKIVERAARRGIRAAIKSGDKDAAKEIEDSLAFTLETEAAPQNELSAEEQAELAELKQRFGR